MARETYDRVKRDRKEWEHISESEQRRRRSAREIAWSIRKHNLDREKSRYDMAFDFVVQLLRDRQPRIQLNEEKIDRFRRDYNIDRIVRMVLKSRDFDGNLSVEKFAELFDRWILPRIVSGSFIRSAERRALTKGWKFDDFLSRYEGKRIENVYFMNDIDRMFSNLVGTLKDKYKEIKAITFEPVRIRSYKGKTAIADAHMTIFTDRGVEDFSGEGEASETKEHTALMGDLVRGVRDLAALDLSDKTVDLSTQHEAKFRAVTAMLEQADRFLKKGSAEEGASSSDTQDTQPKEKKNRAPMGGKTQVKGGVSPRRAA